MISQFFKIVIAVCSFIYLFLSIFELTYFLSFPRTDLRNNKDDPRLETSWVLLKDMMLLSIFVIQHSVMATNKFKTIVNKFGLSDLSRCLYSIATAHTLLFIVKHWLISDILVWKFSINYKSLYWCYFGVHCAAWIIIYVANICTDVTELFGLKQVYYSLINLPDPNNRKSYKLRMLTTHMRHPSFLGFLIIFWFYPDMTLDRLLLSSILTLYMYFAWNTDGEDYDYQKYMYQRKYYELQRLR
ncbi:nurim homolog [Rhynchophorus ferrugineus]|uniref:Nuclear envelope membrane protein n=1 Tax=Rhynchophorus ferrugineus TaxID=354439 RepID=A0A834I4P8_RHYFE|nr:hypothetical protein GWI33_014700 [Rhynchophorus ferrugineus]